MTQINQSDVRRSVAFLTLGCKVNSYETEAMEHLFRKAGYQIKTFNEKASVYIVNTCTVTNIADRKSRQMLHRAKKVNPDAVVVAVGCYVQAANEVLEQDAGVDLVVGNNQKKDVLEIVEAYIQNQKGNESVYRMEELGEYEELTIESAGEKTRANIKIQDGCNQFCSYCIIPYTRGRVRSRDMQAILAEVKRLVNNGYQEVVLTGIHLSSYGVDWKELEAAQNADSITADKGEDYKSPLLSLITAISEVEGISRIRLGSLEPRVITEDFVQTLSKNEKFCPHFHLSLQSGCDSTLKRMNRKYTTEEYYEKCTLIREYFGSPAITTDIITGFPGETEEEFEDTAAFLKKVSFSQMHIFKYSKRKGTKAESMEHQIDESVKAVRSQLLSKLNSAAMNEYRQQFIGSQAAVLFEEEVNIDGVNYQVGHNERYLKLAVAHEKPLMNQIKNVHIIAQLNDDILLCEII